MFRVDNAIDSIHAKGGCYLCGSPNKLVDTEIVISYEGVLAICEACARDLAMTAGWNLEVRVDDLNAAEYRAAKAEIERDSAERALAEIYGTAQAATKRHKERERKARLNA